jgi:plasmid stabilization system protein ParE
MMQVQFDPRARREADRAEEYFLVNGLIPAENFVNALKAAVARIVADPTCGTVYRKRYRWVMLRRYRYVVYYHHPDADRVVIYAVAHASRKPGYWLYRTYR